MLTAFAQTVLAESDFEAAPWWARALLGLVMMGGAAGAYLLNKKLHPAQPSNQAKDKPGENEETGSVLFNFSCLVIAFIGLLAILTL